MIGRYAAGEEFACPLFPGDKLSVDAIFRTQSKKSKGWRSAEDDDEAPEPIPEWILPPEMKIGLEYFFHLGHPERRWEFWVYRVSSGCIYHRAAPEGIFGGMAPMSKGIGPLRQSSEVR